MDNEETVYKMLKTAVKLEDGATYMITVDNKDSPPSQRELDNIAQKLHKIFDEKIKFIIVSANADFKKIDEYECVKTLGGHCWEYDNVVLTTHPPRYRRKCKHCGIIQISNMKPLWELAKDGF